MCAEIWQKLHGAEPVPLPTHQEQTPDHLKFDKTMYRHVYNTNAYNT